MGKRSWDKGRMVFARRVPFSPQDEPLLINSVLLALVYERQRLKDLYS